MATITTNTETNLIILNTATTVNLGSATQGQIITIRDSTGFASSVSNIRITLPSPSEFNTGLPNISNIIQINQPFGFATVQYDSTNGWGILNTFGLESSNTIQPFEQLAVNTIFFNDQAGGIQSQLNVSNSTLLLNGGPIEASGGGGTIPNPLNAVTINASNINVSSNTTVNGTVTANFVDLKDQVTAQPRTISLQNNVLYRGNYQINPIGGYIEFKYLNAGAYSMPSSYPLYVGELTSIENGWWPTPNSARISGFITFPGFSLVTWNNTEYSGTIIHSNTNTGLMPLYSNVDPLIFENGFLSSSYKLTAIN